MEVWDDERFRGIMYLTDIQAGVDARVHIVFFDRKVGDKVAVCNATLRWVFDTFRFHRLTAVMPNIYFSTLLLAKKCGFKPEGLRREVFLMGGKWVNESILGLFPQEITDE
jgi:RimJ/RimL family protein N-acetyltransferase